ncbi:uncharacterized protein LOC144027692 [Festucalex cinctus]
MGSALSQRSPTDRRLHPCLSFQSPNLVYRGFKSSQVKSSRVNSSQVKSSQVFIKSKNLVCYSLKSKNHVRCGFKSSQVKSSQVKSSPSLSSPRTSSAIASSPRITSAAASSQVKSSQVHLYQAQVPSSRQRDAVVSSLLLAATLPFQLRRRLASARPSLQFRAPGGVRLQLMTGLVVSTSTPVSTSYQVCPPSSYQVFTSYEVCPTSCHASLRSV